MKKRLLAAGVSAALAFGLAADSARPVEAIGHEQTDQGIIGYETTPSDTLPVAIGCTLLSVELGTNGKVVAHAKVNGADPVLMLFRMYQAYGEQQVAVPVSASNSNPVEELPADGTYRPVDYSGQKNAATIVSVDAVVRISQDTGIQVPCGIYTQSFENGTPTAAVME